MHSKLALLLFSGKSISSLSNCRNPTSRYALFNLLISPQFNRLKFTQNLGNLPYFSHFLSLNRHFSGYAVEQFSDDEYECDFETNAVFYLFIYFYIYFSIFVISVLFFNVKHELRIMLLSN